MKKTTLLIYEFGLAKTTIESFKKKLKTNCLLQVSSG
jgi:hypothetical protein